jgi:DNA mismatch endonuclease, patch repair protein
VRIPAQNRSYWNEKIARNGQRDEAAKVALTSLGWEVIVLWECELKDENVVVARLRELLGESPAKQLRRDAARTGNANLGR